jgi:uncharacterized protein with PQ loop repeat
MIENQKYHFIAVLSGILTILGFSSLILSVHTTKQTENLTYIWVLLVLLAQILLLIYATLNNLYGMYLSPIIIISGLLYIVYVKMSYENNVEIENNLKLKNIL